MAINKPIFPLESVNFSNKSLQKPKGVGTIMAREIIDVYWAKIDERAKIPTKGSDAAAGWDLYAIEETVVKKGESTLIRTGLKCAIPEGWEGQIRCRSSLGKKGMIMPNGLGTIDSDYRGELMVLATWIGKGDSITLNAGERVAQMLFAPVPIAIFQEVTEDELPETNRGEGGFGSSGRF